MSNAQEEVQPVVVPNSNGTGDRLVHRSKRGMFAKRPAPPSAERVRSAVAHKLTEPNSDGVSEYERVIDSMLDLAKHPTDKTASASCKAAEFLSKSAGFSDRPEEKMPFINIILSMPELPMGGEWLAPQDRPRMLPSFIDSEIISTNPAPEPTSE
jgi:hypothetical protein